MEAFSQETLQRMGSYYDDNSSLYDMYTPQEDYSATNFSNFNVDNTYLESSLNLPSSSQTSGDFFEAPIPPSFFDQEVDLGGFDEFLGEEQLISLPETTLAQDIKEGVFNALGVGEKTAKAISAFAKAAQLGGGKKAQAQGQGRGRIGPGLTTGTPRTSAAGRTSRARQATSGERAVQSAISQSNRAQSAARAIANQMARAGTVTTTNDLADMISGATSPKGTKQALPGTRLRQLAIPRTA